MRVFGVDYQFLACGDVFTRGLEHAAAALSVSYAHAAWNTDDLATRILAFKPDLVLVVHGRKFTAQWTIPSVCPKAVWLLDEPYEVDDTASWSGRFDHVFVNDQATLDRHQHAAVLPVCYDPRLHYSTDAARDYRVGFIGGGNATRDRYLAALAAAGLLDYVVGGSWQSEAVQRKSIGGNCAPDTTASLYRRSQIIVNVFRERHHFNARQTVATAMNPRIYEALACGALVVSEWRPEIAAVVPELPTFASEAEAVDLVRWLLAHPKEAEETRKLCAARLKGHTYEARLRFVLATCQQAVPA